MEAWAADKFVKPTPTPDAPTDGPEPAQTTQLAAPPHAPLTEKLLGIDPSTGLLIVGGDEASEGTSNGSARRLAQDPDDHDFARQQAVSVTAEMRAWLKGSNFGGGETSSKRRLAADIDPRAHPTLYVVNTHLVRGEAATADKP